MELVLKITSGQREIMASSSRKVFDASGGTIGRASDNDWVLPDPERIISSHHAKIIYRAGDYYLQDISKNGVFYYDDGEHRIGRDNEIKLNEGIQFAIKDYTIEAALVDNAEVQQPANADVHAYDLFDEGQEDAKEPAHDPTRESLPDDCAKGRGAQPDHSAALDDYIKPPESRQEEIPENWYETGIFSAQAADAQQREDTRGSSKDNEYTNPRLSQHDRQTLEYPRQDQDLLDALFRGLEMNEGTRPPVPPVEFVELVGKILRECIQGLIQILMARAHIKDEFRISMTRIQPRENNPLKFAMDVGEALEYLLIKRGSGFLPPLEAVNEAVRDLEEHQMATLAGMREAFITLIERFGPKALESEFDKALRLTFSKAANRRFRYWNAYNDYYRGLTQDTDTSFQRLFGEAFVRAYEEQVERLRAGRAKPTNDE